MNTTIIKTWTIKNKKTICLWTGLIATSLFFTALQTIKQPENPKPAKNIDTYIPEGFVLLPIELSNGPSLEGLLKSKGVVDLYTSNPVKGSAHRIAEAVKIIRSPQNPSYFAVLVPEKQAGFLIQKLQAFYAVIQNPLKTGTKIQALSKTLKRTLIIELDMEENF